MKMLKIAGFTGLLVIATVAAGLYMQRSQEPTAQEASAILDVEPQRHIFLDFAWAGETLIAVGSQGQIWRSTDQGETWQPTASGTRVLLTATAFPTATHGWAVGHFGTLLHTSDGGLSWSPVPLPLEFPVHFSALDIAFADEQTGYIVGSDGLILETRDGGNSWQQSMPVQIDANFTAIEILPSGLIIVVADDGSIYRKAPGETDWEAAPRITHLPLFGILATGSDDGVLVFGDHGEIFYSEDGGWSWHYQPTVSQDTTLYTGLRTADGSLILSGSAGVILRRAPGQAMFYLDAHRPAWPVLNLTEASDGTLLVAGVQGLGRLTPNGYRFMDEHLGLTGHLRTLQLMNLPETQYLLELVMESFGDRGYAPRNLQQWILMEARSTDGQSLLTPSRFPQLDQLKQALAERDDHAIFNIGSLWSRHLPIQDLMNRPLAYATIVGTGSGRTYDEAEAMILADRIRQFAAEDILINREHTSLRFYLGVQPENWDTTTPQVPKHTLQYLEALRAWNEQQPDSSYQIQPLQLASLTRVQPTGSQGDGAKPTALEKNGESSYLYALTTGEYALDCDDVQLTSLAERLEPAIRSVEGIRTTLSAAELVKWTPVSRRSDQWKWFTTGLTEFDSPHYGNWGDYYCLRTLVIAYGKKGAANVTEALNQAIRDELKQTDSLPLAQQLQVTAYQFSVGRIATDTDPGKPTAKGSAR